MTFLVLDNVPPPQDRKIFCGRFDFMPPLEIEMKKLDFSGFLVKVTF